MRGFFMLLKQISQILIKHKMDSTSSYIKYLISNLVLINDWIEKFGIENDEKIIKSTNNLASEISDIMNRMDDLGIDISQILEESFDVESQVRDFKLKRILNNDK